LACATLAILVCTLFPFEFFRPETATCRLGSFWRCFNPHPDELDDFLENILLFMPFGFAWACWSRRKGWGRFWGPGVALVAGAGLSFAVEFSQLFLPTREASWSDVLSNALGSLLGYSLFAIVGNRVLSFASRGEGYLERILSPRRIVAIFVVYAALGCGISAGLQRSIHLRNGQPADTLRLGTGLGGWPSWRGRIFEVNLASKALRLEQSGEATRQGSERAPGYVAVPFPKDSEGRVDPPPGTGLLATRVVQQIQKTNQFTLKIRCAPADVSANASGVILALPDLAGPDDFDLVQHGRGLTFALRTADLGKSVRWDLQLGDPFKTPEPREIILTYDGVNLAGYVDGRKAPRSLRLTPGAILVSRFKGVNPYNVRGYGILYDFLVFVPLGVLLGFAVRKPFSQPFCSRVLVASGLFLPSLLQEGILAGVSGRPFHSGNLILGICLSLGAWLTLNSDQRKSPAYSAAHACEGRPGPDPFPGPAVDPPTKSSLPELH
jgi:glycopeptide antibiotics resistance protein